VGRSNSTQHDIARKQLNLHKNFRSKGKLSAPFGGNTIKQLRFSLAHTGIGKFIEPFI
jgi:hypothetical protein